MTREEAIYELKNAAWLGTDHSRVRTEEAVEMAIQALSQEPCDECRNKRTSFCGNCKEYDEFEPWDAISRDALIAKLTELIKTSRSTIEIKAKLIPMIEKLPSVTQKSETVTEFADRCRECGKMRKGHWIYDETIENWRCSKCNETPKTMGYVGTADFMAEHFKFCNHCGAKMVEPRERSE